MSIIRGKDDLKKLYEMAGEKLNGIIYEPEESEDLMLVFTKHTVNISGNGVVSVEVRQTHDNDTENRCKGVITES